MPSPIFTHQRCAVVAAFACLWAGVLSPLCAPGPLLPQAQAAAGAALDQGDGYGAKMLEKIVAVWAPPPALKGFHSPFARAGGRKGAVTDCVPLRSSGMEALDISACGAVRQGGGYGVPPYAQPLEVQLAFWTGTPKGKPRLTAPSSEEALRAEVRARTKAEAAISDARAAAAEDRPRKLKSWPARRPGPQWRKRPPPLRNSLPRCAPGGPFPAAAGRPVTPAAEPRQAPSLPCRRTKRRGSAPGQSGLSALYALFPDGCANILSSRRKPHPATACRCAWKWIRKSGETGFYGVARYRRQAFDDIYASAYAVRVAPAATAGPGRQAEFTLVLPGPDWLTSAVPHNAQACQTARRGQIFYTDFRRPLQ